MKFKEFYMKRHNLEDIDDWAHSGEEMNIVNKRFFDTAAEYIDIKLEEKSHD